MFRFLALRLSTACVAVSCSLAAIPARAADLTLFCAGAMQVPVAQLLAERSSALPHVAVTYATAGVIRERIEKGDVPDVVIAPGEMVYALMKEAKIDIATRRGLGITEIGVAIRAGAPVPDIGSPDALRATLLAAKKVVIVDPKSGTSGGLAMAVFDALKITDAMQDKLIKLPGGNVVEAVARGDADLGLQQVSEILPVAGVQLVGTLPTDLKRPTRYDIAVMARAGAPADARLLVDSLDTLVARALIEKSGFSPAR